ncbi:MAG: helix-turn-helix transcriptional regulator [Methanocorpusculum sp.]|nr:helix-turn-helix transcriptional regulator [Methanocorpusculum sp.]
MHTKIRERRDALGLTQGEVAERAGVRRETIVHLEKGKYNPSLKLAYDLAEILETPVTELFWFTEEE